ncbi:DUF3619 family protein [Janthinobacterium fluminis]|uniref:DUF3619 family protein n=1 Tax=Janthinobacterium fluminis TaxID=2987524 RepID=A0ABT5JTH2_9BURK|nr:DUF3619 family protein [Janthinobacterium fluminis]MDC8756047.1 DUF3619 family protein [Janthinobacterium fluminis]
MNTDDINFAYKVRHALNEKLDDLPASTSERLAAARALAMARKKAHAPVRVAHSVAAGNVGHLLSQPFAWLGRMSLVLPLLLMGAGLVGIYQFEQDQHIAELAELDAAVLSDELPLTAYLDHGFNAYLTTKREQ